jgi:hypothetical protein
MQSSGLGFLVLATLAAGMVLLPRRFALAALFGAALLVPAGQYVPLMGLNFYGLRFVTLLGVARIIIRHEWPVPLWTPIDKAVLAWVIIFVVTTPFHSSSLLTTRFGMIYNFAVPYFLTRCLITNSSDLKNTIVAAILFYLPVGIAMLIEHKTGQNFFAIFGGVDAISEVREGKVRAQGSFAHAINAGIASAITCGFSLMLWNEKRKVAVLGLVAGILGTYSASSSGPILAAAMIFAVAGVFRYRHHSKRFLMLLAVGLVALQVVMNSPVWYLIARVKVFGGSTSWHRAELINSAFKYAGEWWFSGADYTRHWMPSGLDQVNENSADITSEYIWMMVAGGLGLLIAFIGILVNSIRALRELRLKAEAGQEGTTQPRQTWALTAIFSAFTVTFLTVSYFDQVKLYWAFLTAAVSAWQASSLMGENLNQTNADLKLSHLTQDAVQ